jgi:hypothetical protein
MAGHNRETPGRPRTPAAAGQGDRRAGLRHSAVLRVGVLVRGGNSRQLCMIRNIAPGGLMVRVFSDVEPGEPIAIELRADRQLTGRIAWTCDGNAGIQFDRPVDVTDILAPLPATPGWRTRLPRLQVDRLAMIRTGSEISFADARSISQGGVRVICERPLQDGTPVILTLEGFRPLEGVVRWNRDGFCGISFNQVIPPGDLNRLLAS